MANNKKDEEFSIIDIIMMPVLFMASFFSVGFLHTFVFTKELDTIVMLLVVFVFFSIYWIIFLKIKSLFKEYLKGRDFRRLDDKSVKLKHLLEKKREISDLEMQILAEDRMKKQREKVFKMD